MTPTDTAGRMAAAAAAFLDTLDDEQRVRVHLDFADDEQRTDWHYVPRARPGLSLREMEAVQRRAVLDLLATGLSAAGHRKATAIMALESVLAQIEGPHRRFARNPEAYHISIFTPGGVPVGGDLWAWRFEGHHLSIHHTLVDGAVAAAPLFFGANPAQVRHGGQRGLRVLREEEDLARDLLHQLDGEQRRQAIVATEAPADILTANSVRVGGQVSPVGLAAADLSTGQRHLLAALVRVYVDRQPGPLAALQWARVEGEIGAARFVWAGGRERGEGHYYRVLGPGFLAEYDNTQNDANHIHAVWRDRVDDFGADLLRRHYRRSHGGLET